MKTFTSHQIVVTWLERGDCTKRNANTFYSMIQSTNSHVRRLLTEKVSYEEELQKAKELLKGRMQGLLIQCEFKMIVESSILAHPYLDLLRR